MGADAERDVWDIGWSDGAVDVEALVGLVGRELRETLALWAETDREIRALQYRHNGHYLKRRGLRDGTFFNVAPGPVRQGDVCLAASDDGRLAVGVARYERDGTFGVWSDWCGPEVLLSRGEHVRPIGLVAPVLGIPLPTFDAGYQLTG